MPPVAYICPGVLQPQQRCSHRLSARPPGNTCGIRAAPAPSSARIRTFLRSATHRNLCVRVSVHTHAYTHTNTPTRWYASRASRLGFIKLYHRGESQFRPAWRLAAANAIEQPCYFYRSIAAGMAWPHGYACVYVYSVRASQLHIINFPIRIVYLSPRVHSPNAYIVHTNIHHLRHALPVEYQNYR